MIVGIRPVDQPPAFAGCAAGRPAEPAMKLWQIVVFHADEMKFASGREHGARPFVVPFEAEPLGKGGEGDDNQRQKRGEGAHSGEDDTRLLRRGGAGYRKTY